MVAWNFSTAMPSTRERHRIVPPSPASAAAASRSSPRSVPMASIKRLSHGSSTTAAAMSPVADHSRRHILHCPGPSPRDPTLAGRRNEATEPHRGQPTGAKELDPVKPGNDPGSPRAVATPAALHLARARGDAGSACTHNAAERGNAPPPPSLGRMWTSPAAPPVAAKRGRWRGGPGSGGARVPPCRCGSVDVGSPATTQPRER